MSTTQTTTAVGGGDALKAQFDDHFDPDTQPDESGVLIYSGCQCAF